MGKVDKERLARLGILLHSQIKFVTSSSLRLGVMMSLLLVVMLPVNSFSAEHGHGHGHGADPVDMGSVVVTAERIRDYAAENPNQVVVLGLEEITSRNMLSVDEALGTIAGVDVKPSSSAGSRISIRGSGKSGGVLVLLNGRPLNSSQYGGVDLSFISIDTVVSITVFKPPVPVWLGPGAVDGAISIITRSGTDKKDSDARHSTRVRVAGGSYGLAQGSVSHRADSDAGTFMVTAAGNRRDGKRPNSDREGGSATVHWDKSMADSRQVEVDARVYTSEHGSSGPVDNPTPDARQSYQKASLDGRLTGLLGDSWDYAANVYGDQYHLKDKSQTGSVSTLDITKVGLKGEAHWSDDTERWALRFNGLAENDALDHTLSGSHNRTTAGLGVQADTKWRSIITTVGVRGDWVSDFDLNPGASAGMRYGWSKRWSMKINTGYSYNVPTFGQLYQPSHGNIDQARGNPDLDKEGIWSSDLAVEYRMGKRHLFQLALFRTDTDDTILYQRGSDRVFSPVNGGHSWRHGIEATWKYTFDFGLVVDTDVIVQDSRIEDTGNELMYTPHLKVKLALMYTVPNPGTRLETALRYNSEQFSELENRPAERIDDYYTVDVKMIQPFKLDTVSVELFFNIINLFDVDYDVHFGYPDDGFRVVMGVNLMF